ncbi:50S ribosomal protein L23 [Candidatus Termititenax spirochaetophilus]|uniref:Large ribosomal subunit protein uL23 n=1 Tax=Candidatus Termititenax spirochaetophilus TaxID=2218522 RepID=A0A388T8A8_9BACT|nr:50S ribosomal protein L23 [Candidatus Termititenax spirochaetophilus]
MSSIYSVIVRPIITEKSSAELAKNIYTFIVDRSATKIDVRNAVEKIYSVKVAKVNTQNVSGKKRHYGRINGQEQDIKKAVVYLRAGQKIDALAA